MPRGQPKLSKPQADELVRLSCEERLSLEQTAASTGQRISSVHGYLKRRGITMRSQG